VADVERADHGGGVAPVPVAAVPAGARHRAARTVTGNDDHESRPADAVTGGDADHVSMRRNRR